MKRHYVGVSLVALLSIAFVLVQPMQHAYGTILEDMCSEAAGQTSGDVTEEMCLEELNEALGARAAVRNGNGNVEELGTLEVGTSGVPEFNGCLSAYTNADLALDSLAELFFDVSLIGSPPEDPISMNTVRNGNIVKTIHAEKEVYFCKTAQGGVPVIVDVTILGEIYEDIRTKSVLGKEALTITCMKLEANGQVIGCKTEAVPADTTIVINCFEEPFFLLTIPFLNIFDEEIPLGPLLTHPQEMNTVNKGNIVKTIEAQKEIFLCNLDPSNDIVINIFNIIIFDIPFAEKKVDSVTVTEIWEDLSLLPNNPGVKKTVESFRCVTSLGEDLSDEIPPVPPFFLNPFDPEDNVPRVESCKFTSVPVQELE